MIKYQVTLANTNKGSKANPSAPFTYAGMAITLPAATTYVKARVSPLLRDPVTKKGSKVLSTPVYDEVLNTVTWPEVDLPAGKIRRYLVYAQVLPSAVSPLVFSATCPTCWQLETQSNVTVRVCWCGEPWQYEAMRGLMTTAYHPPQVTYKTN